MWKVRGIDQRKLDSIQHERALNQLPFVSSSNSTIGPTISANTGIRTVDAGMPQLSMHSCREVMGIVDLTHGVNIFKAFYNHFRELDDNLSKEIV